MKNTTEINKDVALKDRDVDLSVCQATASKYFRKHRPRPRFWRHIKRIRKIEREGVEGVRVRFYQALEAIYKLGTTLSVDESRKLRRFFLKADISPQHRDSYDCFRILIDLCSRNDRKSRSRSARALRYAFASRNSWKPSKTFKQFLHENGGVSGCARKIAKPRRKRRPLPRYWA